MKKENLTVRKEASLKEAMRTIDKNRLGTVFIVDDDGHLEGVATDGDIRRGIISGTSIAESVRQVMNDDPLYIYDSWSDERIKEYLNDPTVQNVIAENKSFLIPILDNKDTIVDFLQISEDDKIINEPSPPKTNVEHVLIIGGAGYIGSVLTRMLLDRDYNVTVLDNLLYGRHGIEPFLENESFKIIQGDMRSIETVMEAIKHVDAVVHLGGLVGDPASGIDAQKTLELNYHSVKMVAEICSYHQINRFIFASTCSVYGRNESSDDLLTEESPLNPVSLYAKSKIESERALQQMRSENFSPTILRKATVYGLSPRMRFDLVVNILSAKAYKEGVIPIFGGDQYRPNVHVADAAQAYIDCLEAPIKDVDGEVFNVGSNAQNYQIEEIGRIVSGCFPDAEIDHQKNKEDERSYRVNFEKIQRVLGYEAQRSIRDGCMEIKQAFESDQFRDYTDEKYSNYKTLENNIDILSTI